MLGKDFQHETGRKTEKKAFTNHELYIVKTEEKQKL
jgi:hypothetical protein